VFKDKDIVNILKSEGQGFCHIIAVVMQIFDGFNIPVSVFISTE
jgi:hypothetical protein